jgi:hypothetical protein
MQSLTRKGPHAYAGPRRRTKSKTATTNIEPPTTPITA